LRWRLETIDVDTKVVQIYVTFRIGNADVDVYVGHVSEFDSIWLHRVLRIIINRHTGVVSVYIDWKSLFVEV